MNDRAVSLLEKYDIDILRTRKGRGTIICETEKGNLCFQEYHGQLKRLEVMKELMNKAAENGVRTQMLYATTDGELLIKDGDGVSYILKSTPEGRELNPGNMDEVKEAIRLMGRLHNCMILSENPGIFPEVSMKEEYDKRNREIIRAQRFLRKKGQKGDFERELLSSMDFYMEKALAVYEAYDTEEILSRNEGEISFCHGDFQYHHLIYQESELYLLNFEKIVRDRQIRDLYFFLRKILEKNNWDVNLGCELLKEYEKEKSFTKEDLTDLYYRFAYPEKYWKLVNFYMNAPKCFIPAKNMEKLRLMMSQESGKDAFLKELGGRV